MKPQDAFHELWRCLARGIDRPSQSDGDALYTYMEGISMGCRWLKYGLCKASE